MGEEFTSHRGWLRWWGGVIGRQGGGGGLVYVFREYVQPSGLGIKPWDEIKQGLKVMSIKLQCEN